MHLWLVWSLILNVILSFQPSCWGFSFALGHGLSFFGGTQHSPFNSCPAMSCNFGVLAGEDELISYYPTFCYLHWEIYSEKPIILKDTHTTMFISALFTIARTWKQLRCPNRWMIMKECVCVCVCVCIIHNRILLNHKKEQIWVSLTEVNKHRAC